MMNLRAGTDSAHDFEQVLVMGFPRVPRRHALSIQAASSRPVFLVPTRRDLQRTVFEPTKEIVLELVRRGSSPVTIAIE